MQELKNESEFQLCPRFEKAFVIIGKRWTGLIIRTLMHSRMRFSDMEQAIPHLSARMLSARIRELEQEGLVRRLVRPESPIRIEYELTEKGRDLSKALTEIQAWAERWS